MFVFPVDAEFMMLSEGALVGCWQKGIFRQIKESSNKMEASRALTCKLLKTHALSNTNETVIEQAGFHIQIHTKRYPDFNVPLPFIPGKHHKSEQKCR